MLSEWNYTLCNLWRSAFFTQHASLEIHSSCGVDQEFLPFYCWGVFPAVDVTWLWRTTGLFLVWSCYKEGGCEHLRADCSKVQLLFWMIVACLILQETVKLYSNGSPILHSHLQSLSDPLSLHPVQRLVSLFFMVAISIVCSDILCDIRGISLMAKYVGHFFMCLHYLQWNICLCLLSIFEFRCFFYCSGFRGLYILYILVLCDISVLKIFSPSL